MRAAVLRAPRTVEIVEAPVPVAPPGGIAIRVEGCGVCASNVPPYEGREWFEYPMPPGALGHEGWGRVTALGEGTEGVAVGDRVAFLSNGAYAEHDVAEAGAFVVLPPELDGRPFPGEPLGCAVNVLRRARVEPGGTVAILGVGFLGALLVQMLARAGARVVAFDRKPSALEVAETMGAADTILLDDHWRVLEAGKAASGGDGFATVIEVTGKEWPLQLASGLCAEYGHLVIAGYHQDGMRQINVQEWNWRCLTVSNAHERDPERYRAGMAEAARLAAAGTLDAEPLLSHEFPLERLGEALELAATRPEGFMKAWVRLG